MASSSACAPAEDAWRWRGGAGKDARVSPSEISRTDQRFPRHSRITSRRQFQHVYEHGRRVASGAFVLFGVRNQSGGSRLGLTVTRRIGGAVIRNRAKRRLREVFRRHRHELLPACDLVLNVRPPAVVLPFPHLEREFLASFRRLTAALAAP